MQPTDNAVFDVQVVSSVAEAELANTQAVWRMMQVRLSHVDWYHWTACKG